MPVKNLSEVSMVVKIASGFRGIILTCDTYVCFLSTLASVRMNSVQFWFICVEGVGLSGFQILLIPWLLLILRHHRLAQFWNCPAGSIGSPENSGHADCDLTQQGWKAESNGKLHFARGRILFFWGLLVLPILIFPKHINNDGNNSSHNK